VHLQVQVLDVTIDESIGQGINWNLISKQSSSKQSSGQFQISNNSKQVIDGAGLISIGSPIGTALNLGNKISLSVMLNLSQMSTCSSFFGIPVTVTVPNCLL
jgi:type II secretory pathway component GspD/PulD (secretin)